MTVSQVELLQPKYTFVACCPNKECLCDWEYDANDISAFDLKLQCKSTYTDHMDRPECTQRVYPCEYCTYFNIECKNIHKNSKEMSLYSIRSCETFIRMAIRADKEIRDKDKLIRAKN